MSRRPFKVGDMVVLRERAHGCGRKKELDTWSEQVKEFGHPQRVGDVGVVDTLRNGSIRITFARLGPDPDWWGQDWFDPVEDTPRG